MVVSQHAPETPERPGGNRDSQHRNIALQKRLDVILPPPSARLQRTGEKRTRKSPAEPEPSELTGARVLKGKATQFEIADPAGESFRALPDQFPGCAPKNQILLLALAIH